jgi:flagellar L-ring protein precursor FlgH
MARLKYCSVLVCLFLFLSASLFKGNSLYSNKRGFKVGDLIEVLIVEETEAEGKAATDVKKESETSLSITGAGFFKTKDDNSLSLKPKNSSKGEGTTNRKTTVKTSITVKVVEILPNGNLRIEGEKEVTVNKEKQRIKVSGEVDPRDVDDDGRIYSTKIADAKVEITGVGPLSAKQRRGIFTKLFDLLF